MRKKQCGVIIHNKFVSEQDQNARNRGIATFRVPKSLGIRGDFGIFSNRSKATAASYWQGMTSY